MNKLDIGVSFDSHDEFLSAKREYEEASKTVLIISKAEKLKTTDSMSTLFRYQRFTLSCKAGRERPCQSKGLRKSSTIKRNCSFEVRITLRGGQYKIYSVKCIHENHNLDEQTYKHYAENMRLTTAEIQFINEMIKAGANKHKIKTMLMERRNGQPISLKSIHNVQTKSRIHIEQLVGDQTELEKLLEKMNKIPNARIKVVVDENNELLGILFQDERMAKVYEKYPELLLVDAIYKLNNRRIPLFILLVVDGNGESEIACLWFIKSESRECMSPLIDSFKELNTNWTKTKVIISDKDLSERIVFSEKFNGIPIQICLFHALRNFNREITTAKRAITAAQREVVLDILVKMAYSRSSLEYENLYTELCDLNFPEVTKYFNENWNSIRSEWTLHGKNEWNNYMNYTNNRLESLNQKIKIIGTRYASLLSFFDNIIQSYSVISSERDIKAIKSTMKIVRQRFDDLNLKRFNEFLTSYVFEKLLSEYEKSEKVPFTSLAEGTAVTKNGLFQEVFTKEDSCTCGFFKTMQLPCRHIFQFLKSSNLDMFVPNLCATRWTKKYYYESHPALNCVTLMNKIPTNCTILKVPEEIEKYKLAAKVTKDINGLLSTLSPAQYSIYMDKLKHLRGEISIDDNNQCGSSDTSGSVNNVTLPMDLTWNSTNTDTNISEQQIPETTPTLSSVDESINTLNTLNEVQNDMTLSVGDQIIESNFAGANSNFIDIRRIRLPSKNIIKGRPKGSGRTVVGTKKKIGKITNKIIVSASPTRSNKRVTRSSTATNSQSEPSKRRPRSVRV